MANGQLTELQKRFADHYIETANATEAYKKAGYKSKSESAVQANACRLISNDKVRAYIDARMSEKDSERIASQDEILEHLTRVMRREEKEYTVVTLKTKRVWFKEGKRHEEETERVEVVEIPTRVSDTNKAAELLGKRYNIWKESLELSGDAVIKVVLPPDWDDAGGHN